MVLNYSNWLLWEHYMKSSMRHKNAKVTLDHLEPINPHTPQVIPATATTPAITVTPQPTAEELKAYHEELEKWEVVNNIMAGVILGSLLAEVKHLVNPDEPANAMYDHLKATIMQHTSGSSAYRTQIELVQKQFTDAPMLENFEKHITFFCLKNAKLITAGSGLNDSFLAFLLLYLFNSRTEPMWMITSTNIASSGIPTNQWSFEQIAGKLCEALRNGICSAGLLTLSTLSTSGSNQSALNTMASKAGQSCYNRLACTYPKCCCLKSHTTKDCWMKEKDKRSKEKGKNKKKHKAKKMEKQRVQDSSSSELESMSDSELEPCWKKRHQAH